MKEISKSEVLAFLDQVIELEENDFLMIRAHILDVDPAVEAAAAKLARLGAADFSWVNKTARDAIRSIAKKFTKNGLLSLSGSLAITAAEAIVNRDKLSTEQYEALVGGFRKAGVVVPEQEG